MRWFLYAISYSWIAIGTCSILFTDETRNVLKGIFKTVDRKILSVFEAVIGILLLFSAAESHHGWFIRLIGLMALMEGAIIFFIPKKLYDDLVHWYLSNASDQTYRLFGIISIILGTAVLSWIM